MYYCTNIRMYIDRRIASCEVALAKDCSVLECDLEVRGRGVEACQHGPRVSAIAIARGMTTVSLALLPAPSTDHSKTLQRVLQNFLHSSESKPLSQTITSGILPNAHTTRSHTTASVFQASVPVTGSVIKNLVNPSIIVKMCVYPNGFSAGIST